MKRSLVLFLVLPYLLLASEEKDKSQKHKGTFYFSWGYNKDWFSKSDLHFSGQDAYRSYDFTLYDVKAKDSPRFGSIFNWDITIPQFIYRFGYYFNNRHNLGIEIGFDHAKYIMVQDQTVHIKGSIDESPLDKDTLVTPRFLLFEHTNGANFLMLNLLKRICFFTSANQKHRLNVVLKPGAGIVIPRTDVTVFGVRRDNIYHIAGYITGIETSVRYEYRTHWFAETGMKGCFANYLNVLTVGEAKASHHFFSLEALLSVGYALPW